MTSVPYQERLLYGNLFADLLVYIPYAVHAAHSNSLGLIASHLFLLIVVQIVVVLIIAAATRNRTQDERDMLIRLRGYRAGYVTFVSCVVVGLGLLWMHAALGGINPNKMAIHFLSVMFGMLVIADIVRVTTQLIAYRRYV